MNSFTVTVTKANNLPPVSAKANARAARVKAAVAAGRSQNRRLLRGFTV
jgi:hypothetical protein